MYSAPQFLLKLMDGQTYDGLAALAPVDVDKLPLCTLCTKYIHVLCGCGLLSRTPVSAFYQQDQDRLLDIWSSVV